VRSPVPPLPESGDRRPEAWFLGPKAENAEAFEDFVLAALRDHAEFRRRYHTDDPIHVTDAIRAHADFQAELAHVRAHLQWLLDFLKRSVPFFSLRHQGHMTWETTMPALVGYFAGMLHNPNNTAFEGSPATSVLERWVGDDLCEMLGYSFATDTRDAPHVNPWGHLTSGGSVANLEALWVLRDVKFQAAAVRAALLAHDELAPARAVTVTVSASGVRPLLDLDPWSLLNLPLDVVLALPGRIEREFGISAEQVTARAETHSVRQIGFAAACTRYLGASHAPLFITSGAAQHSLDKAMSILGLGADALHHLETDVHGRLSLDRLRETLERCIEQKRPVFGVVLNMGSTELSAIDPIVATHALREKMRARGLDFGIHADAAWGGYFASMLRDDYSMRRDGQREVEGSSAPTRDPQAPLIVPLSAHASREIGALHLADTVTADPHKSGYIPYAAGALCYRNEALRFFTCFTGRYAFHGDVVRNIGIFGVEGSKPGATAAAVYLSHAVIRPSRSGYGTIIGETMFSCKKFYARLLCLAELDDVFRIVPVPPLPVSLPGATEAERIEYVRRHVLGHDNSQMLRDPEACRLLTTLGPDLNILSYAVNFRRDDGTWNTNPDAANRLNLALYERLSLDLAGERPAPPLILSSTDLETEKYGAPFVNEYCARLLGTGARADRITVLRSVVMDPWVTETDQGSFLDVVMGELRRAILAELKATAGAR